VARSRRVGEWRVGDVVQVNERGVVAHLGEGHIIDLGLQPDTNAAVSALVRFDNGSAAGVWYGVGNLNQVRDIFGNSLTPGAKPFTPATESEDEEQRTRSRTDAAYTGVPMSKERIEEIRKQANTQDADPYDDAEMLHECLDVIEALQRLWRPPGPYQQPPSMKKLEARLAQEEAEVEAEEDAEEELARVGTEATAESVVVVRCCCETKGPGICPRHKNEPCDTMGCDNKSAVLCDCGIRACPVCKRTNHGFCYPDM